MSPEPRPRLDKPVFFFSLLMLLGMSALLLVNPDESAKILERMRIFMTADLGWLFLGFVFIGSIWLAWLAFSRHGDVVLGDPEKGPDYSNISWFGMLFWESVAISCTSAPWNGPATT